MNNMQPRKNKLSVLEMKKMKSQGIPLTWVTAYDMPFAYAAEQAGIDMILVGDSGGMVGMYAVWGQVLRRPLPHWAAAVICRTEAAYRLNRVIGTQAHPNFKQPALGGLQGHRRGGGCRGSLPLRRSGAGDAGQRQGDGYQQG